MAKTDGTKVCKHCQTEISKKAKVCPQCRKKQGGGIGKIILIVGVLFLIIGIASGGSDDDTVKDSGKLEINNENNQENQQKEEVDNIFSVGEYVETDTLKISFLSASDYISDNMFIEPKDGYKFIRVEFEFENIGKNEEAISSLMSWSCYADDYSMEQSWVADDVLDATISAGKKAKGAIYFEVPVDAEKITVEYETNFWTEKKVIFEVK